ncbi:hypothetical protein Syun_008309 [Stephania yunnanensis]|uniref:DUF707 domain-containing protein n=1 Tax=Stephania yunnanensis TaxID=152371 RepID=A0AAP0KF11_9MAGN
MKRLFLMTLVCATMLLIYFRTAHYQRRHAEMEAALKPFETMMEPEEESQEVTDADRVNYLPRGIIQATSDLELRPLWQSNLMVNTPHRNLLAISVGIKQMENVDEIVRKFLSENFTIMLFHYDGNEGGWMDFEWYNKTLHISALNQTKWWFAKRFLHPDIVSIYNYIFIWDEDLGVENFNPGRYLKIVKSEGLDISQPALDPSSAEIHHRITVRKKTKKVHRRIYERRGSTKCSDSSDGPPCTGYVEGMAPVFSSSAWRCTWNLIQNDLVHGWGLDKKFGYCAQGDRTKKVGIVDSEFIVHLGVQTLGGSYGRKVPGNNAREESTQRRGGKLDMRSEIRRQSTAELQIYEKRWEEAARNDKDWTDPYAKTRKILPRKIH